MVMNSTSTVEVSIQAVSPELRVGAAGASAAGAAAAAAGAGAGASSPKASIGKAVNSTTPRTPNSFFRFECINMEFSPVSKRIFAGFTGADTHDLFEVIDKNFAVADLVGARRLGDRLDHPVELLGVNRGFDLDLRQQIHDVFRSAAQ